MSRSYICTLRPSADQSQCSRGGDDAALALHCAQAGEECTLNAHLSTSREMGIPRAASNLRKRKMNHQRLLATGSRFRGDLLRLKADSNGTYPDIKCGSGSKYFNIYHILIVDFVRMKLNC